MIYAVIDTNIIDSSRFPYDDTMPDEGISPIQRPHYIPSSYTYQFFEKSYSCIVFRVKDC